MADPKTEPRKTTADKAPDKTPQRVEPTPAQQSGGNAAASSDPQVQHLLAMRQTAQMNNDDAAVAEVDKQLADLGFTG